MKKQEISFVLLLLATHGCVGGDSSYPSIAAGRPPGTVCGNADTAAKTKRFPYFHPLGPTGGWGEGNTVVDYTRTRDGNANVFRGEQGTLRGYVKFDTDGTLRLRTYDDVYGSVYCGWAPKSLEIRPTEKPVFVQLDTCFVGDGGVAMVHELCWFPKGSDTGTIIYSSAHRPPRSDLSANDVFLPGDIGGRMMFPYGQVVTVIRERLIAGDTGGAQALIEKAIETVTNLSPYTDPVAHTSIPASHHHSLELSVLRTLDLGLSVRTVAFGDKAIRLVSEAKKAHEDKYCFLVCGRHVALGRLYLWLDRALVARQQGVALPDLPAKQELSQGVVGRDPLEIRAFLAGEKTADELTRWDKSAAYEFWIGIKSYLTGDADEARAHFSSARTKGQPFNEDDGFELAASAALGARL